MYAVIETGGKQYRVEVGTELEVEHLDVQPGDAITLDRVLLISDGGQASIGQPLVRNAIVSAEVLRQDRGEKLISFKYRPKARRRVKKGHRQELTVLRVTDVRLGERSAAEDARAAAEQVQSERERLREAAARQAAADAELAAKLAETRPAETPTRASVRGGPDAPAEAAVGDATETEAADAEATGTASGRGSRRRSRAGRAETAPAQTGTDETAPAETGTDEAAADTPEPAATEEAPATEKAAAADGAAAEGGAATTKRTRSPRSRRTTTDETSGPSSTGEDT